MLKRHLAGRFVPLPRILSIEVTSRCNLRCVMCPKTAGFVNTAPDRVISPEVVERLEPILGAVDGADLSGLWGEAFLFPDLYLDILARLKRRYIGVHTVSNGTLITDAVAERLTTALLTGQNPREAARAVMATGAELTRSRADTIARTELLRAQREATRARLEDAPGIDEWVWLSAADSRTCAVCWAMHGTRHPVTDTLDGHPNCRCTMVPAVPGGSADKIPTGDELLAKLPDDEARKILGPKRHDLW